MKKTLVLMVVLLSAVSLVLFAGGAAEREKAAARPATVIRISNGINELHPAFLGGKEFEKIVESRLPGRYDIQVFANAQLGDDVRATEAVRLGTLEMVTTSAAPLTGLIPEFSVFDLPFIVPNERAADAIYDGPVGARLAALLEPRGLKLLTYMENGFRHLTNSVREVRGPADLRGMRVRTMQNPIHLSAWRALGANPTPMPFSEVFTAMQQGTIDGQENPVPTIYLQKFYEVQRFVTLSGHVYTPFLMLINKRLFDSFPAEDQKIMLEAAQTASKFQRDLNRQMSRDLVANLRRAGMTVTELTAAEMRAFHEAVRPVYDEWVPRIGKELVAEFQAAAAAAR